MDLFFNTPVPSGYPESITGVATSPQSVVIAWDPPLPESQNGVITSYVIDVFEVETGDMFQLNSATNSLTIDSLSPYTTYVCVIAAMTSVGLGPFSTNFTIRTLEDGKKISFSVLYKLSPRFVPRFNLHCT